MYAYKLVERGSRPRRLRKPRIHVSEEDAEEYDYYVTLASLTLNA